MTDAPRKSTHVTALLVGGACLAALGGLYLWDKTNQPPVETFYPDLKTCLDKAADATAADACRAGFDGAQAQHLAQAPRFADKASCEAQFGPERCQPHSGSQGSWFMPMLMGYMMGRTLGGAASYTPVYRDSQGYTVTPGGRTVDVGGARSAPGAATATTTATTTTTAQRGGFGATADSRGVATSAGG